jgi:hypothetical protein
MLGAVAMLVGVAAQPASAGKGSEIEQFIKRIGKYADDSATVQKPRGLCVCQDGGPEHTQAGALVYDGQLGDSLVTVRCWTRGFSVDGQHTVANPCDTFEVLSK